MIDKNREILWLWGYNKLKEIASMVSKDILLGKQVLLRACMVDDVTERYVGWLNDPEINQYLETRYKNQTLGTVADYVRAVADSENEYLFAIVDKESDRHIGNMHLTINVHHKTCFHAYVIGEKAFWGRGIAKEAIRLITKWAFDNLDIDKMDGGFYAANIGSGKAVLACGYREEGRRIKQVLLDNGERCDAIPVGLLREEYEQIYKTD